MRLIPALSPQRLFYLLLPLAVAETLPTPPPLRRKWPPGDLTQQNGEADVCSIRFPVLPSFLNILGSPASAGTSEII